MSNLKLTAIPDLPGFFLSNSGDIYNSNKQKMKKHKNPTNTQYVSFRVDGVLHTKSVQKIIKSTWFPEVADSKKHIIGFYDKNKNNYNKYNVYIINTDDLQNSYITLKKMPYDDYKAILQILCNYTKRDMIRFINENKINEYIILKEQNKTINKYKE